MTCCQRLRRDHEAIGEVSVSLQSVLAVQAQGENVPPTLFAGAVEFFTALAERCHETMEERVLFPVLAALDVVESATLTAVAGEHEEGRRLLAALRALCARAEDHAQVSALLLAYVTLERRHLEFEGTSLLTPAERALSDAQDAELQSAFDRIEQGVVGPGGREALLALGGAIARTCRVISADGPRGGRRLTVLDLVGAPQETVSPEDTLSRAAELMDLLGTREVAVIERGALVGILTRTDLEPHRGHLEWTRVRAAMTPDPVSVAPDCTIATVAGRLLDGGFNSVAVSADRHLFGMIRRSDLLRVLRDDERSKSSA